MSSSNSGVEYIAQLFFRWGRRGVHTKAFLFAFSGSHQQSTSTHGSYSNQTSALHGSVDSLDAVSDASTSLQSNHRISPTTRSSSRTLSLTSFSRRRSSSCPAAIERAHVFELDNMWLQPHYQNFIAATLAGEQPSARLRFPDNGVVLLGDFSFSTTLEPNNRNHGG